MSTNLDVKVVILGCEYSGKTSLAQRFLNDRFVGENKYQVKVYKSMENSHRKTQSSISLETLFGRLLKQSSLDLASRSTVIKFVNFLAKFICVCSTTSICFVNCPFINPSVH